MIIDERIKHEVKKRVEKLALTKECPNCGTIGRWRVSEVCVKSNVVPKTKNMSAKKDFDHPFDFVVPLTCLQCGYQHIYEVAEVRKR